MVSKRKLGNMGPDHRSLNTLNSSPTKPRRIREPAPEVNLRPATPTEEIRISTLTEYNNVERNLFGGGRRNRSKKRKSQASSQTSPSSSNDNSHPKRSRENSADELQEGSITKLHAALKATRSSGRALPSPKRPLFSSLKVEQPLNVRRTIKNPNKNSEKIATKTPKARDKPERSLPNGDSEDELCLSHHKSASMNQPTSNERTSNESLEICSAEDMATTTPASSRPTSSLSSSALKTPRRSTEYSKQVNVHAVVSGSRRTENFIWGFLPCRTTDCELLHPVIKQSTRTAGNTDSSWLRLRLAKLNSIKYNPESQFVVLNRSSSPTEPALMAIKFETVEDASDFIGSVHDLGFVLNSTIEKPHDTLEATFRKAMAESRQCAEREAKLSPQKVAVGSSGSQLSSLGNSSKMNLPSMDRPKPLTAYSLSSKTTRSSGPPEVPEGLSDTRATRALRPRRISFAAPIPWTEENPNWREQWPERLMYPRTGKGRAVVEAEDIERLDEGGWLNDNVMLCYINFLKQRQLARQDGSKAKVYFMSTFFHPTLKPDRPGGPIKYDAVKSWTSGVDIFSFDYIVVPVIEHSHWYLAIITNPGMLLPKTDPAALDEDGDIDASNTSPSKESRTKAAMDQPRIYTMDSLGGTHVATTKMLRKYLVAEMNERYHTDINDFPPMGYAVKNCPLQENGCDCGVFVLGFIESFLDDTYGFIEALVSKKPPKADFKPSELREKIRNTLFELQKIQIAENEKAAEEKRQRKLLKQQLKARNAESSKNTGDADEALAAAKAAVAHIVPTITTKVAPKAIAVISPRDTPQASPNPVKPVGKTTKPESPLLNASFTEQRQKFLPAMAKSSPLRRKSVVGLVRAGEPQSHKRKWTADLPIPSIESLMEGVESPAGTPAVSPRRKSVPVLSLDVDGDSDAMDVDAESPLNASEYVSGGAASPSSDSDACGSAFSDTDHPGSLMHSSKARRLSYMQNTPRGTTPVTGVPLPKPIIIGDDDDDEVREIQPFRPLRHKTSWTHLQTLNFGVPKGSSVSEPRGIHGSDLFMRSSPGPSIASRPAPSSRVSTALATQYSRNLATFKSLSSIRPSTAISSFSNDTERPSSSSSAAGSKTDMMREFLQSKGRDAAYESSGAEERDHPFTMTTSKGPVVRAFHTRKRSSTIMGTGKEATRGSVIDMTMD